MAWLLYSAMSASIAGQHDRSATQYEKAAALRPCQELHCFSSVLSFAATWQTLKYMGDEGGFQIGRCSKPALAPNCQRSVQRAMQIAVVYDIRIRNSKRVHLEQTLPLPYPR
jgi:hypothetical protein